MGSAKTGVHQRSKAANGRPTRRLRSLILEAHPVWQTPSSLEAHPVRSRDCCWTLVRTSLDVWAGSVQEWVFLPGGGCLLSASLTEPRVDSEMLRSWMLARKEEALPDGCTDLLGGRKSSDSEISY